MGYIQNIADSISRLKYENCGRKVFRNTALFLLATRVLPASPNFGQAKQGQKFVVPTFHIHFLNPECVTIPWVLAPKNFPIENFRVRSDLQKVSLFHEFSCPLGKKKPSACCGLNFDATDLPHSSFEPLYPKLFRGTQNIPYLFKNLSKSRLSDPFFGLFSVISEVGSQIYIANLAIECFQQLFGMKSHCMP